MNNQSVSLVATTNIKQDRQKIWQPTVGRSFGGSESSKKTRIPPPPVRTKKIVSIEQIVARPYVPCNLAIAPLILVSTVYNLLSGKRYALLWSCFDRDHTHKHHSRL